MRFFRRSDRRAENGERPRSVGAVWRDRQVGMFREAEIDGRLPRRL